MSIHNLEQKIKPLIVDYKPLIIELFIIVVVSIGSFYLGALSKETTDKNQKVEKVDEKILSTKEISPTETIKEVSPEEGKYIASKNGKIYYPVDCKAGNRIKDKNRVYFRDIQSAEYVGYKKTKSCTYI